MEWIETTGSTVDEAKDRALDRLGIAEDDMQFEIIDEGSSSLFRLKRKEARLRARVKPVNTKPKFDRRSKINNKVDPERIVASQEIVKITILRRTQKKKLFKKVIKTV